VTRHSQRRGDFVLRRGASVRLGRATAAARHAAWSAAALAAGAVALGLVAAVADPVSAAVPAPGAGTAVVQVYVGDLRSGPTAVGPLAGARFGLFTGNPSASIGDDDGFATGTPAYTCTSDADGDCSFVVPIGTGAGAVGQNTRLWVAPIGAPAGYYANPYWQTAPLTGGVKASLRHVFQTPPLVAGQTYRSGASWITDPGQQTSPANTTSEYTRRVASDGVWTLARDNPPLPARCGINVALVVDLSSSVGTFSNVRPAMDAFIDALRGTPSQVEILTFGTDSPANGYQNLGLTSVATTADAAALKARYAGWTDAIPTNYTNWDRALAATAATNSTAPGSAQHLDLTVLLTDGNPTVYGTNPVGASGQPNDRNSGYTRFRELSAGLASANLVKSQGTRILAVGVGDGVSDAGAGYNLRTVSGQVAYDGSNALTADYYQTANYTAASTALRQLVLASCAPSISVIKRIVPNDWDGTVPIDDVAEAPSGSWNFSATTATPDAVVHDSPKDTDLTTGGLAFDVDVDAASSPATFTITETAANQDGYEFLADQTVCVNKTSGSDVSVPAVPGPTGSFSVDVGVEDAVSCVVYNRQPPDVIPASVTLYKRWRIHTAGGVVQEYDNGAQPSEIQAQAQLSLPAAPISTRQAWEVPRRGYAAGGTANVNEATFFSAAMPGCTVVRSAISPGRVGDFPPGSDGGPPAAWPYTSPPLVAGDNPFTITNDVECHSYLTVRKVVGSGTAAPSSWALTAAGPTGALAGPAGRVDTAEATHVEVTPEAIYTLAEAADATPADLQNYAQVDLRSQPPLYPGSTGSWVCRPEGLDNGSYSTGLEGAVTVPLGQAYVCTTVNQTAFLTVIKQVDGGDAQPGDFTFHVTPLDGSGVGVGGQDLPGAAAPGTTIDVRPLLHYRITEVDGPPGYQLTDFTCTSGVRDLDPADLVVEPGGSAVCTAVNTYSAWTATKTSNPASGTQVRPGDVIAYTLTATQLTGPATVDAVVTDDLSAVLDHASLVDGSIAAQAGSATLDGTTLTWTIPQLTTVATLTYQVRVDDDAWGVTLRNQLTSLGTPPATPPPGGSVEVPCADVATLVDDPGSCDATAHPTPPAPPGGGGVLPATGASVVDEAGLAAVLVVLGLTLLAGGRTLRGRVRRRA
jgi:hypothetical protein